MIRDANLTFSKEDEALSEVVSENIIDLSAVRDAAVGGRVPYFVSYVTTALTDSGNNSNMTLILQTDSVEAFNSATNTRTLGVFATNAAVGARIGPIALSPSDLNEQYAGILYSPGNGNFTTAKFTSFITFDPHLWTTYPDNVTVSVP